MFVDKVTGRRMMVIGVCLVIVMWGMYYIGGVMMCNHSNGVLHKGTCIKLDVKDACYWAVGANRQYAIIDESSNISITTWDGLPLEPETE